MKNFVARGDAVEITASADISSGDVVVAAAMIGIATGDIANGENGIINLTGVYDVPKAASQAWTVGAAVYWDPVEGEATTEAADNLLMGVAVAAVGSGAGETIGRVRLNGAFGVPVIEGGD